MKQSYRELSRLAFKQGGYVARTRPDWKWKIYFFRTYNTTTRIGSKKRLFGYERSSEDFQRRIEKL